MAAQQSTAGQQAPIASQAPVVSQAPVASQAPAASQVQPVQQGPLVLPATAALQPQVPQQPVVGQAIPGQQLGQPQAGPVAPAAPLVLSGAQVSSSPQRPTAVPARSRRRSRSPRRERRRRRSPSPSPYSSDEHFSDEDYGEDEDIDEPEDDASFSFRERLNLVYSLLGDRLSLVPQVKPPVRSAADPPAATSSSLSLPEALPWSPGVPSAFNSLQSYLRPASDPDSARRRGHKAQRRAAGKFFSLPEASVSGKYYKFLEEVLPLVPPLPEDGLADLCDSSFVPAPEVRLPYGAAVTLEEGLRRLLGVASHADWFSAAALTACGQLEGDTSQLSALLQSWNRSNSDIMQLATWAVANMFLARRDAFGRSFSADLPSDRRTWLRCQPLNSSLLFGGVVDEAREVLRDNRRDRAYSSVLTGQKKDKPFSSSSSAPPRKRKRGASSGRQWRGSRAPRGGASQSSKSRRGGGNSGGSSAATRGGKTPSA